MQQACTSRSNSGDYRIIRFYFLLLNFLVCLIYETVVMNFCLSFFLFQFENREKDRYNVIILLQDIVEIVIKDMVLDSQRYITTFNIKLPSQ